MSAFLGPVHHWMYNKILLQEQLTDRIVALAVQNGWQLDESAAEPVYEKEAQAPLETVIDTANIHGWLSDRVGRAEQRFAQTVQALLQADGARLAAMETLLEAAGNAHAGAPNADVEAAYQTLDGLLLDGMPCDGGRRVTAQDADSLLWEYDAALHPLCRDADGKAAFAALRQAFLRGVLAGSGVQIEALGETVYRLKKGA